MGVDDACGRWTRWVVSLGEWCWRKQEMGWPGRLEGCYVGCGWEVVVVVYVGETVHVRDSQLQAPTHRPPRLRSDVMRNEYSSGSLAGSGKHKMQGVKHPTVEEEDSPNRSTPAPTLAPQTRHQPEDRVCGPRLHRGVCEMSGAWWSLHT